MVWPNLFKTSFVMEVVWDGGVSNRCRGLCTTCSGKGQDRAWNDDKLPERSATYIFQDMIDGNFLCSLNGARLAAGMLLCIGKCF